MLDRNTKLSVTPLHNTEVIYQTRERVFHGHMKVMSFSGFLRLWVIVPIVSAERLKVVLTG